VRPRRPWRGLDDLRAAPLVRVAGGRPARRPGECGRPGRPRRHPNDPGVPPPRPPVAAPRCGGVGPAPRFARGDRPVIAVIDETAPADRGGIYYVVTAAVVLDTDATRLGFGPCYRRAGSARSNGVNGQGRPGGVRPDARPSGGAGHGRPRRRPLSDRPPAQGTGPPVGAGGARAARHRRRRRGADYRIPGNPRGRPGPGRPHRDRAPLGRRAGLPVGGSASRSCGSATPSAASSRSTSWARTRRPSTGSAASRCSATCAIDNFPPDMREAPAPDLGGRLSAALGLALRDSRLAEEQHLKLVPVYLLVEQGPCVVGPHVVRPWVGRCDHGPGRPAGFPEGNLQGCPGNAWARDACCTTHAGWRRTSCGGRDEGAGRRGHRQQTGGISGGVGSSIASTIFCQLAASTTVPSSRARSPVGSSGCEASQSRMGSSR